MSQQFILHAGARPAEFSDLKAVVEPKDHPSFADKMKIYRTLRHDVLASHIRNTIRTFVGPDALKSEHYALSSGGAYPGAKMFGMMKIDLGNTDVEKAAAQAKEFADDTVNEADPDDADDPRNYIHQGLADLDDAAAMEFEESENYGGSTILKPDAITPALFFRNSYDRSMSVSTAFGYQVFACDNLAVSGDLNYSRKHTRNMLRDVIATISILVQTAGRQHEFDLECKKLLSEMEISDVDGYRILGEMAGAKALNIANGTKSQFATALLEWNDPTFDCFKPRTMWSLYNAITFAMRLSGISKRLEDASIAHARFIQVLGDKYVNEALDIRREFSEAIR